MSEKYIVYKLENIIEGKIYVGATTCSIEDRIRDHIERTRRVNQSKLSEAISTYGTDAFT